MELDKDIQVWMHNKFFMKGRMISGKKNAPEGHVCVFNGNICTKSHGKIWFGDLDLTKDNSELEALSEVVGEPIYILREYDARFEFEKNPQFDKAVAVITHKKAA